MADIIGTPGDDNIGGTPTDDTISGLEGNDVLIGQGGDDTLDGGDGDDLLRGRDGNDTVLGGNGDDYVQGGEGDDVMDGGAGIDRAAFLLLPGDPQIGATVDLAVQGVAQDTGHGLDTLIGIEHVSGTIYSDTAGADDAEYDALVPSLRHRVGRLINDRMPTGVAVSPAQNHGGPFPSTGHPGFTAVGIPASLLRFAALHSYDHVRQERLPIALRDANPTGSLVRLVDGQLTTADL